jgi:hypothetical protein
MIDLDRISVALSKDMETVSLRVNGLLSNLRGMLSTRPKIGKDTMLRSTVLKDFLSNLENGSEVVFCAPKGFLKSWMECACLLTPLEPDSSGRLSNCSDKFLLACVLVRPEPVR